MGNLGASGTSEDNSNDSRSDTTDDFPSRMSLCATRVGSVNALARKAGIAQSTIRPYFEGSEPKRPHLVAIARAAGVSVSWLATGEGTPVPGSSGDTPSTAGNLNEHVLIPFYQEPDPPRDGTVAAPQTRGQKHMAFRRDWLEQQGFAPDHLVLVTASGDAMAPTIDSGDLILVDTSEQAVKNDSIYLLRLDDGVTAKRLQRDWTGGVWVRSDNTQYRDQHIASEDCNNLKVVGRAVWIGCKL